MNDEIKIGDSQAVAAGRGATATSLNNLAALSYYEKALGDDHPDTQSSCESLAVIEATLG